MALDLLIDRYCHGWSVADADERRAVLASVLTPDARYSDPGTGQALELAPLLGYIAGMHARWPGLRIVRISAIDAHHDVARFQWALETPQPAAESAAATEQAWARLVEGIDFVELGTDGADEGADDGADDHARLRRITGFFGPLAPIAQS